MDGVGISIIERPRPLHNHDTPNSTHHTYTLKCEEPRELTGIVDLTRGEDHPTARLLDLVPGRSGTVYKNWLEERGEQFRSGIQIATLDPFQGQQERRQRPAPRRHQRARRLPYRQARWRRPR